MDEINLCDDCIFDPEACECARYRNSDGSVYSCAAFCDSGGDTDDDNQLITN